MKGRVVVIDEALCAELLSMREEDLSARARLAADGSLWPGYHPEIEAVHRRNAARLEAIVDEHGWPGRSLAGDDGADAAWMVAQHAIVEPERCGDGCPWSWPPPPGGTATPCRPR